MYYQDQAIVLARQDFREDDLLVTCYTQKHGKVILQSKGAKKILSKLAGHLEPMSLVEINCVAGKGRDKIIGANLINSFSKIKNESRKVFYGFYFLEILNKSIKTHHSDKRVFEFLKSVLQKLENCKQTELDLVKLSFDYKILFLLGHNAVYRKELDAQEKKAVEQIVQLKVDDLQNKFNRQILNKLYNKSKLFFEEIIEEEIKSLNFLNTQ